MASRVISKACEVDAGDGLRLHVESSGQGPHTLLLHGFTGSTATWTDLRERLEGRFTVHAVDLPGHGKSGSPSDPDRYSLDRFADDLERVLDALRITAVPILGYSLGGRAALRFALAHPDRVSALMLESASAGVRDESARAERRTSDDEIADSLERDGVGAFVDRWEKLPLFASQASLPETARASLRAQRLAGSAVGLANSLRGAGVAADPPVLDRLGQITVPTLLVAGALDEKFVGIARALRQAMPRAQLHIVDGAGHAVHLERPVKFAAAVADFLESLH